MTDCIFCRIAAHETPARIVYEDSEVLAFEDLTPQAPVHILVIPRSHCATTLDLSGADDQTIGRMIRVAAEIATKRRVAEDGFRLVVNTNANAGQSVYHLHLHLLAGRSMGWPPG